MSGPWAGQPDPRHAQYHASSPLSRARSDVEAAYRKVVKKWLPTSTQQAMPSPSTEKKPLSYSDLLEPDRFNNLMDLAASCDESDKARDVMTLITKSVSLILNAVNTKNDIDMEPAIAKRRKENNRKQGHDIAALYEDPRAMSDVEGNRQRIKAGTTIRVRKVERMRSHMIDFMSREYVPSPAGPIHEGLYTCLAMEFVGDYVRVLVFTSKQQTGFKRLSDDECDRYVQVEPEGSDYRKHDKSQTVLFSRGADEYAGSMLCLAEYLVHLSEYIAIDYITLTPESLVRLHKLIVDHEYVTNSMKPFLKHAGIAEDVKDAVLRLGTIPGPGQKLIMEGGIAKLVSYTSRTDSAGPTEGVRLALPEGPESATPDVRSRPRSEHPGLSMSLDSMAQKNKRPRNAGPRRTKPRSDAMTSGATYWDQDAPPKMATAGRGGQEAQLGYGDDEGSTYSTKHQRSTTSVSDSAVFSVDPASSIGTRGKRRKRG
ncbi:hypothetical protein CKM354_001233000 [Cercospora kikuchii]|uniref:Uncharacterized protein n=1 Tax=Cercospora kikuchii TaxID=84275 RepID=A0A9P3FLS4_9PEZI|nr:uncharacterized protein CKM354_001233000 [Cercospora kikuchii]GIZ49298.1 hypothetical protein CKM354_001233000 [Cercospora kikuchii]